VRWKTVPLTSGCNRKRSVADGALVKHLIGLVDETKRSSGIFLRLRRNLYPLITEIGVRGKIVKLS